MIKSRVIQVYKGQALDRSNISFAAGKCGVYQIFISGKLRYIGYSGTQLEKTILRHFQSWPDATQVRVSYSKRERANATVRITLCRTPTQAQRLEAALIIKCKPVDNPEKLKRLMTKQEEIFCNTWDGLPPHTYTEMEEAPF